MPRFFCSFVPRDSWLYWQLGGSTKATNLAVRKCRFSRSEFPIKIKGFCSWNRQLFCCPNGRFSVPLCHTGMQGDFMLQTQSKSDIFGTSKLLSISEDVQLLWDLPPRTDWSGSMMSEQQVGGGPCSTQTHFEGGWLAWSAHPADHGASPLSRPLL